MHFVGPDQLHGFEERRTTDIYPADFGWTPDWLQPRRAHRLVVPQHGLGDHGRASRRSPTSCCSTTRSATRGCARCTTWPAPTTRGRGCSSSASPTRTTRTSPAAATGTSTRARHPAAHGRRGRRAARPAHRAAAAGQRDGRGARSARRTCARARRAYYGNISYLDEWTARLTGTLDALGVADDTVVVLLADHGDMLGERGLWYKMNFFEGSARVPLIVHAPKRFAPKRVADAGVARGRAADRHRAGRRGRPAERLEPSAGRSLLDLCAGGPLSRGARGGRGVPGRRARSRRSS